jgi:hypothetical protein
LEKKLRVALDWTLDLIFSKDLVQFTTDASPSSSHPEHGEPERATAAVSASVAPSSSP